MIKVGIIGATGYAGVEIVRLIQQHKEYGMVQEAMWIKTTETYLEICLK